MFKLGMKSDTIQFGILLISGLAMIGGLWTYCEAHFAKQDDLNTLSGEVHALYLHLIPAEDRR